MTVVHPQTETRIEYAVRYDDPPKYGASISAAIYTTLRGAEGRAADLRKRSIPCTVVRRTVTYGEWEPVP